MLTDLCLLATSVEHYSKVRNNMNVTMSQWPLDLCRIISPSNVSYSHQCLLPQPLVYVWCVLDRRRIWSLEGHF